MIVLSCDLNNAALILEIKHRKSLIIKSLYLNERYIRTVYVYIYCENNIERELLRKIKLC